MLGIILMFHLSLNGIFSHPQWVIPITIFLLVLMSNNLKQGPNLIDLRWPLEEGLFGKFECNAVI